MKVRATRLFHHLGNTWREGDVISLNQDQGIHLLQKGLVEPVLDLEPYRRPLDADGLSLGEAYLLDVRNYPPLKPFLDVDDLQLQRGRLRVRQYARLPKWLGLPATQSERLRKPNSRFVRRGLILDDAERVRMSAQDPWSKSGPNLKEEYQKALRDCLKRAAIHFFFERLANKELDAVGVSENDLKTLKETKIPAGWWRRDILLDLSRNDIWELLGPNPKLRARRYSEVRILPPTASQGSGRRGRRSRRPEMVKAFGELWANRSLTKDDLTNKKGVRAKILQQLGYANEPPGFSYTTFVKHVGPLIDQLLVTRDSEN